MPISRTPIQADPPGFAKEPGGRSSFISPSSTVRGLPAGNGHLAPKLRVNYHPVAATILGRGSFLFSLLGFCGRWMETYSERFFIKVVIAHQLRTPVKQLVCDFSWTANKASCSFNSKGRGSYLVKKNEIMPFAGPWMDLEIIRLSELSQTEKDKYHMISLYAES